MSTITVKGLFLKFMKKRIPVKLLVLLEKLVTSRKSCVKWNEVWSAASNVKFYINKGVDLPPSTYTMLFTGLLQTEIHHYTCQQYSPMNQ